MKEIRAENGVVYFTSEKIKATHAFATRLGGVSTHEHTGSLNLAYGRGDSDGTVKENLCRFADAVGFDPMSVVSVPQIHSNKVMTVTRELRGNGYFVPACFECDGYVTRERGVCIGVKTADCVPILLEDCEHGVIGALHAGWRGTFSDICKNGVEKMCELGAVKECIVAVIGEAICKKCYEVGRDVMNAARDCMGDASQRFFSEREEGNKYLLDMTGANKYLLMRAGLFEENIEILPLCTYEHPELFWSHRYTRGKRGTMLNVITLGDG